MASEITLRTNNGDWKVEVEAWKNTFFFYNSIGTQATVYHREKTKNIWGSTVTDWVKKKATSIHIRNIYSDEYRNSTTREKTCGNSKHCELKESAVGASISIPSGSVSPGAVLEIDKVDGTVTVNIKGEILSGKVSASSFPSDSSIW